LSFQVNALRKYVFGLAVVTYLISIIGLPVYYHYCGGELEEISYLVKGSNCCGDEEEEDNGCCEDQGFVFKNASDAIFKQSLVNTNILPIPIWYQSVLPNQICTFMPSTTNLVVEHNIPPPKLQQSKSLSVTILRI
jgi:hypothetical protein